MMEFFLEIRILIPEVWHPLIDQLIIEELLSGLGGFLYYPDNAVDAILDELLPYTDQHGITFIPYFPLEAGLLTGKYKESDTFEDLRKDMPTK